MQCTHLNTSLSNAGLPKRAAHDSYGKLIWMNPSWLAPARKFEGIAGIPNWLMRYIDCTPATFPPRAFPVGAARQSQTRRRFSWGRGWRGGLIATQQLGVDLPTDPGETAPLIRVPPRKVALPTAKAILQALQCFP